MGLLRLEKRGFDTISMSCQIFDRFLWFSDEKRSFPLVVAGAAAAVGVALRRLIGRRLGLFHLEHLGRQKKNEE